MVNAGDSPEAVAAQKLLQMKHYQPSISECRATSQLLSTILHQTNALYSSDQRKSLTTPGRSSTDVALCLAAGDDDECVSSSITRLPIPLADTNDEEYLSPLQCYIRKTCLEYFAADASNATSKGRQTLVSVGRVGVRCVFCKHLPRDEQAAQASEYYLRHCFPPLYGIPVLISHYFVPYSYYYAVLVNYRHLSIISQSYCIHPFILGNATMPSFPVLHRNDRVGA